MTIEDNVPSRTTSQRLAQPWINRDERRTSSRSQLAMGKSHWIDEITGKSRSRLLCVKSLKHVIHSSVISNFERNNILTDCQQGFRKRRSCETQLILTIDDLARGLNDKQQIDGVLGLDLLLFFLRPPL